MTPAGWTVMILSVGAVVTLACYCLYRVFTLSPVEVEDHLEVFPDVAPRDRTNAD